MVTAYPANMEDKGSPHQTDDNGDDVVDFGAHTGDNGAFGWYADFPVHAKDE